MIRPRMSLSRAVVTSSLLVRSSLAVALANANVVGCNRAGVNGNVDDVATAVTPALMLSVLNERVSGTLPVVPPKLTTPLALTIAAAARKPSTFIVALGVI